MHASQYDGTLSGTRRFARDRIPRSAGDEQLTMMYLDGHGGGGCGVHHGGGGDGDRGRGCGRGDIAGAAVGRRGRGDVALR